MPLVGESSTHAPLADASRLLDSLVRGHPGSGQAVGLSARGDAR
ncbi:hypothetical protein [Haladaptatus pallidirubidus]|nr:hypothetical protein [Haladaptatus pallidirubidus]